MLDQGFRNVTARAATNAPSLVSWGCAMLIAVELGRIAITALGSAPLQSTQAPAAPSRSIPQQPPVDVQAVADAHLFGVAGANANVDPNNAPVTAASLVLAGTIATDDPKRGVAIISDGGPSKVYSVGQQIGGARVHSVYLDRVLLDRAGSLESLLLPRLLPGGSSAAPARGNWVRPGSDARTAAAIDHLRRRVQADPGILYEVMRTVPSYDNKAGKLRGFRAYPGKNRTAFANLGLKPGDLVTAINGTPLDDPQRSQEVLNTIQTSEHATVTIERSGQRQDLTLNVAQVAQQASKDLELDSADTTPAGAREPASSGASDSED